MLNNKGTLYLTDDISTINSLAMRGTKVLYIGEFNQNLSKDVIQLSCLLPPFDALEAEINGDMEMYSYIYENYLNSTRIVYETFATIIVALWSGVSMVLYIEEGDSLNHINFIREYFLNYYGIKIGTNIEPYQFYPMFNSVITIILYTYLDGFIPAEVVLKSMPMVDILKFESDERFNDPIYKMFLECFPDIKEISFEGAVEKLVNYQTNLLRTVYIEKKKFITFNNKKE